MDWWEHRKDFGSLLKGVMQRLRAYSIALDDACGLRLML
jgi:hypothetical protein